MKVLDGLEIKGNKLFVYPEKNPFARTFIENFEWPVAIVYTIRLFRNAIKFILFIKLEVPCEIKIYEDSKEKYICFTVEPQGLSIDNKEIEKILQFTVKSIWFLKSMCDPIILKVKKSEENIKEEIREEIRRQLFSLLHSLLPKEEKKEERLAS